MSLALPRVYARCRPRTRRHRVASRYWDRPARPELGLRPAALSPWRTAGRCEPGTTMAVHGWRRGPRGSGLSRCGVPRHVAACSRSGRDRLVNRPDLAGQHAHLWAARRRPDMRAGRGRGRGRPSHLRVASRPRPCPAGLPAESTVEPRCGSGLAVPAGLVGWLEPGNRPRAVRPGEAPDDAPARGDRHRARLGARQGPHLQLLAEARGRPSVHSADVRLALPGLPRPRPAVLQPRRPAVSGARHRAAGGGAGPAVAGEGDDEGRHRPRSARR
jgi:hypothetical protein